MEDAAWHRASLERFAAKLNEECGELQEATLNYFENPDSESDRQELISEAGDVMWLTWALASNAGVSMEAALKQLTNRYVHGIRWVRPGPEDVEPTWRDAAIAFATKFDHLRIADFDAMIAAGFEPTVSTHMNIYEDFDYELPEDILRDIDYLTKLLVRSVGQQYGKTESSDQDPQLVLTSQEFARRGEAVGELASRVTLLAAHFLWRIAGVLPSQIFTHNIKKVSGRVSSGLVDKTDGERPAELK